MKQSSLLLLIVLLLSCSDNESPAPVPFAPIDVAQPWVNSTTDAENMGSLDLIEAKAESSLRLTSVTVIRNGRMVYEKFFKGYKKDSLHDVRSVTKSVVSLLTGLAIQEGFIASADDRIALYLSPDKFELTDVQKSITIRHLLTMSGGFDWNETNGNAYNEWVLSNRPIGFLLDKPMASNPGSSYNYNSAAVHLLGVIVSEATHMPLPDFADQYLFSKLGITNVGWERADETYVNGGSGIQLRPEDMARIGQLVMQKGRSGSEQIINEEWITTTTTPAFDWRREYGVLKSYTYGGLWWVHDAPMKATFAWGYGGQYIYILPEKNLVVVTTTNWIAASTVGGPFATEQQALDLIITHILPKVN